MEKNLWICVKDNCEVCRRLSVLDITVSKIRHSAMASQLDHRSDPIRNIFDDKPTIKVKSTIHNKR